MLISANDIDTILNKSDSAARCARYINEWEQDIVHSYLNHFIADDQPLLVNALLRYDIQENVVRLLGTDAQGTIGYNIVVFRPHYKGQPLADDLADMLGYDDEEIHTRLDRAKLA